MEEAGIDGTPQLRGGNSAPYVAALMPYKVEGPSEVVSSSDEDTELFGNPLGFPFQVTVKLNVTRYVDGKNSDRGCGSKGAPSKIGDTIKRFFSAGNAQSCVFLRSNWT